jgi:hypothetical protein
MQRQKMKNITSYFSILTERQANLQTKRSFLALEIQEQEKADAIQEDEEEKMSNGKNIYVLLNYK